MVTLSAALTEDLSGRRGKRKRNMISNFQTQGFRIHLICSWCYSAFPWHFPSSDKSYTDDDDDDGSGGGGDGGSSSGGGDGGDSAVASRDSTITIATRL